MITLKLLTLDEIRALEVMKMDSCDLCHISPDAQKGNFKGYCGEYLLHCGINKSGTWESCETVVKRLHPEFKDIYAPYSPWYWIES